MKALLSTRPGPPETLEYRDVPSPAPGAGQVIVTMRAASVNFPDLLIIEDKYQFRPERPFAPGSEMAGVVTAVGPGVTDLRQGDRVMAFTLYGAFAEAAAVDAAAVVRMPEGMDFRTAASMLVAYGTMDHALRDRARLLPGETVLVLGAAGGVGLAAIDVAKALGARVVACASSDEKLRVCRAHGADETIAYTREALRERVRALTANRGVDVVVDPVGGALTEPALRSLAWRGRHLVLGFAAGEIPRMPLNLPLLKGADIVGVFWGDFVRREPRAFAESAAQLARWWADGHLRPEVTAEYPLSRGAEALKSLAARHVVGKIVLVP